MASKNSDKDQKKDTIIPNNCQITEIIDLVSSDESDEDVKYLGKIPMKISSNVSQDLENTGNQEENISIRYSEKVKAEMNINGTENIYKEPCRKRKTRDTDGQVSFNKERAVFNLAIKKRKEINSVLSSESTDTEECLNESGECVKSNSSTFDMETEPILEFTPPCRNIKKRKFHTSLNVKKQKQSCAYRSNRELDRTNSLLVSSKRPVVVINNLNVGLSRMTKENREHSINTKIPKAKNVEIIDLDPVSRNTPFSESDKNNSACKLEFPNVDKTELKRILETVNNLHSDSALHDSDKSYKDKLFPTEREDSDQSAESSIPINNFTLETKIENCYTSDVSTNVSSLTLNNITIKTDKENIDSVDVTTKVSLLTFNDATKTENENCESSDAPRNLPALTINNAAIEMEREIFEPDNVSINASPLTSNNVSHSSYLTRLEMQEVLKRIYKTSKESSSDKTLDGQNTSNKSELKNFQNLLGQEAIRNSTAEEKPTDIKLEEETRSHALLCNTTEKKFLTDKIPTKTFRKSESSIPINNLKLETKIENCDSFDFSTNVSPLTLNNVTNKTDKENFYAVDVPTKVSISELNDIIKTEKENYESSFVQRNVSVLTIHNGTIEEESEIFESENVTMNASPLTSKNVSDLSSLTKLELQQVLKRINETSKESSADKNADRKNANNKNEIENFQNLLEPKDAIKNSTDEEKPTDMELEKETRSHGFLCNPTKTSFVIVKIPTKFLRSAESDTIKTEKENCESSFVQRNVPVLTIHNGTIEEESENFESENVTMNASPLTSKNVSDLSSLTKLELQQVLKRINETSKESSADKNADRKNANNKNEIENFQNLLEPKDAIKNSTDEEKPTDMELEKETMSHGFLCNPTKTSFVIVKIPTKFLRSAESDTIKTEKENCESSFVQRNVPVLTIHNGTIEEESENFESENVTMNASPLTSKKVSDSSSLTKLEIQQVLKRIDETSKESSADKNADRKNATNKNEIENLQNLLGLEDTVRNSTDEEKPTDIELEKETRSHGFLCNPTKKSFLIVKIPTKFLRTTESAIPINNLTLKTNLENIDSFDLSTNVNITPLTLNNVTINTDKENFNAVDVSTKASRLMLSDTTKTDEENWESSDVPRNVSALTLNNGTIDKESEIFESDNVSMNAFSLTSNNVSHSSRLTKLDMQEILKRIDKTSEESSTDKNAVNKLEMENLQNLLGPDEEIRNSTSAEKNPPDMKLEKETRSYGLEKTFLIDKIPKEKITENNPKLLNIEREEFPTKSLGINGNFSKHFTHRNTNNPPLPSSTIYSPNNNMLIANRHLNYADSLGNCMSETISDLNYFSKSSKSCINSENILNQCYSKSSDSCINNEKVSNQFLCCPKSTHLSFYPLHSYLDPEIKTSSLCHNPASEMEDYVPSNFGDLNCSKSTSISCSSDTTLKLQPAIRSCFPLPESISFLNSLSSQTLQNEATNVPYEKCYLNIYTQSPTLNSAPSLGPSVYSSEKFQEIPSLVPFYLKSLIGKGNISRDDFLLLILEWNADWLTDLLENQDPPLIAHDLRTIFNSYEYYEDYYNTLFPLMMLETWHRIYATSSDFKQNPPLLGKIDEYSVKKHCTEVKCKAVYKPGMIFPDVGKIIVVRYVLKSKAQAIKVFGYVTEVKSKPIKPVTDSVFIEFLTKKTGMILDPHLMIFLTFKAVYHSEDINKDLPLYIQVLCSIDFNLKQNDALLFMKSCPLQRSILDPTANGFLRFSLSGKHSSEDGVKECVRNILKNILSPNPAPIVAVRTDNVFGHSKVVPFLVQAIRNDCNKMKILICVRHPQTLGKIAHSLSLLKNLEFVIFNKRADTSSKFHKFTLDKIAESKEEKIKEIEGDQKINNEMILKIKKDILLSSDVVLSLVKCSHDKFLAETILEIKSIHEICCIIDEANYCTEPETLIPMLLEIGQLILVGDLGEKAKVLSKTARDYNFNQSFFERAYVIDLINTYKQTRQDCIL